MSKSKLVLASFLVLFGLSFAEAATQTAPKSSSGCAPESREAAQQRELVTAELEKERARNAELEKRKNELELKLARSEKALGDVDKLEALAGKVLNMGLYAPLILFGVFLLLVLLLEWRDRRWPKRFR